jgi:tRNA G18 (ribose-2'-O)-methylase SpoU
MTDPERPDALAAFRLLAQPSALAEAGYFVVEGREAIARLLGAAWHVEALLLTPAASAALAPTLEGRDIPVIGATSARMQEVTGFNFHRGALALVRRPVAAGARAVLQAALGSWHDRAATRVAARPLVVVAEHLVDVDNVGSAFRNARAFGAACVLLDDRCADPLYRKAVRTSMGTVLELPWACGPMPALLEALTEADAVTVGLTPRASHDARTVDTLASVRACLDAAKAAAIVVGNEGQGLSDATLRRCTHLARIPMADGADSLNVATALAVALYELRAR